MGLFGRAVLLAAVLAALALPREAAAASSTSGSSVRKPLTSLDEVRRLSPEDAAQGLPVRLPAIVTYYHPEWEMLFIQDQKGAVFVYIDNRKPAFAITEGDLVEISGKTVPGDYVPSITEPHIKKLRSAGLPAPQAATRREMAAGGLDGLWTEVKGVVRSVVQADEDMLELTVTVDGGPLKVHVKAPDQDTDYRSLIDASIRVRGIRTTLTNDRRQFLSAEVWVPAISFVTVEVPAPVSPFQGNALSIDSLRRFAFAGGYAHRLKIAATVTLVQPGRGLFLQRERDGVFVQAPATGDIASGDEVEALGFVAARDDRIVLEEATVRRVGHGQAVVPVRTTVRKALEARDDARLVTLKGRFVGRIVASGDPALVLEDGGVVFDARVPQALSEAALATLAPGSLVEVTGVASMPAGRAQAPHALEILLREGSDLAVVEKPSWWTVDRVRGVLIVTSGVLLLVAFWVVMLRRRVQQQTEVIRKRLEREAALEERFELAVQGTNDGIWDWDLGAGTIYFSPRWKSMLGYAEGDVADKPEDWFQLVHPEDRERVMAKLAQHRGGQTSQFEDEHRMRDHSGTYRWVLSRGFASRDGDGVPYRMTGAQTDVTDRRTYDPLTGLPNRALFVERLERAMARAVTVHHLFGVLFLDLDRFKFVNDSLGHLAGDHLLVTFSRRLESCVRPGDMVARFGGDEFAILIDGIAGPHDAANVAERIQKTLTVPFDLSGHEVYTSASIGIALSTTDFREGEDLLRDADTAMYRAKEQGRARFEVFDAVMREEVTAFMRTESDLRHALDRDELRLHYQPIVDMTSGEITAFEALLRWEHPERGLLSPAEFLNVAEETGLIVPIGEWALRRACQHASTWRERGASGRRPAVCVNLSARQAADANLVEAVHEALSGSTLSPDRLVLEVTESLLDVTHAALTRITEVKKIGVRVYLDDFGTGYSSLSYLHKLPIDALKIDRSFVTAMAGSPEAFAIVRAIVTLARSLRLGVIAEGVEEDVHLLRLRELQCEQAQGFYFSKAVDPKMAAAMAAGGALSPREESGVA